MPTSTTGQRLTALAAVVGGVMAAASGALQVTGLDWDGTAVETAPQHAALALFAGGLLLTIPAVLALARHTTGRLRTGRYGIVAGQFAVAAAATASNIRGDDAGWFPFVAGPANLVWLLGSIALAIALYRTARVPRAVAVGLVVAYLGTIPLNMVGGGIVAGSYWLAVGYLLSQGAIDAAPSSPRTPDGSLPCLRVVFTGAELRWLVGTRTRVEPAVYCAARRQPTTVRRGG